MADFLILLPAFAICLLMLFSHTYLGLHILERGIIFVDLALAQVAAMGVSIAFLMGHEPHGIEGQLYALVATLILAFGFAKLREIPNKTMREVTIGCVYVVSTALSVVMLSRTATGMEELKAMFNGNILWASWSEISVIAAVYLPLGIAHFLLREKIISLSFAEKEKRAGFGWEVFFFCSFALCITLAVNVAGVLMVFAFLIIPAFASSILVGTLRMRLWLSWTIGALGAIAGLALSYEMDLPVGATVVSVLGLLPIIAAVLKVYVLRQRTPSSQ